MIVSFVDDLSVLPGRDDRLILNHVFTALGLELHGRRIKGLVAASAFGVCAVLDELGHVRQDFLFDGDGEIAAGFRGLSDFLDGDVGIEERFHAFYELSFGEHFEQAVEACEVFCFHGCFP